MRYLILVFALLLAPAMSAHARVSVSVGINLGSFPELVPVPGYPVYYDPRVDGNYFFYDGLYWLYEGDGWYSSDWYDGPWRFVTPMYVPLFVLRIPVRYYRRPPAYFRGWRDDESPRWGEHWGRGWAERRHGWDHWDRRNMPRAAPLPLYQREYSGDRYPRAPDQQRSIRSSQYPYRPHEPNTRQQWQRQERSDRPSDAASIRSREQSGRDRGGPHEAGTPRGDVTSRPEYRSDRPPPGARPESAGQERRQPPRQERMPQERPPQQMQQAPHEQRAAPPPREPQQGRRTQDFRDREPRSEPHGGAPH